MKHKLKVAAAMVLFITVAITGGCQKDDELNVQQTADGAIQVSTISFEEFKANQKAYEELQTVMRGSAAKTGVVHSDGFYYDTDEVLQIIYKDYVTYTFPIYRAAETTRFENLVIRQGVSGTESFIFEYLFTASDFSDLLANRPIAGLEPKTRIRSTGGGGPLADYIYTDENGQCYLITFYDQNGNYVGDEGIYFAYLIQCPEGHNDSSYTPPGNPNTGGGGPININVVIPGTPVFGPITNPGPPGGGGSVTFPTRPIITKPAVNVYYEIFRRELTMNEKLWLRSDLLFGDFAEKLIDLLSGPMQGAEDRKELAHDILDFAMEDEDNKEIAESLLDYLDDNESDEESMRLIKDILDAIDEYESIYEYDEELISDL
ncbi:MAG TPA: hypothetical protein VEA37_04395 [Flavobacterium sp.]|nr:hypothetical protein [Flavobacterium sp.]